MLRRDALQLLGVSALPLLTRLESVPLHRLGRDPVNGRAVARRHPLFDEHQHATIDQVTELIMPATDTPGARAAGVVGFVEVIVAEYYRDDERGAFLRGLQGLDERGQADFGKTFLELSEPQQTAILTGLEAEARAMPQGSPTPFFSRIKGLTLYGYYTSEIGQREELLSTFMPGRYDGAAPLPRANAAGGR